MPQVQTTELPHYQDPLLRVEEVAARLNVSKDWVWDHSSRKRPYRPVIRMSDGVLAAQLDEVTCKSGQLLLTKMRG